MKKSLLTISMALMLSTLFAQTIIPRVGLTISNSNFEPTGITGDQASSSSLTGFTAGVGYEFTVAGIVSLQPEINFIRKGQKLEETSYPDGYEYKIKHELEYNYLEIPVLAKVKFGSDVAKFYVSAGPSIAIGLGGTYKLKSTFGGITDAKFTSDIKFGDEPDNYDGENVYVDNKTDIGLQLGGGVVLFKRVMLDVRYGLGLTDLYDDEDSKNNTLQFSVGVPINLF